MNLSISEMLSLAHFIRYHFKQNFYELIDIYSSWMHGMEWRSQRKNISLYFPILHLTKASTLHKKLIPYFIKDPVAYDIELTENNNFIFLTGANMGGKSTFIKAVGSAVFLAHIGMGVPASQMHLTLFDGLLSNINVEDNVIKGESYFL